MHYQHKCSKYNSNSTGSDHWNPKKEIAKLPYIAAKPIVSSLNMSIECLVTPHQNLHNNR